MGNSPFSFPSISLPKAGGSIRGMGEKFSVNPSTGTGSFVIPVATSPGRNGNGVQLSLSYDSGSGNGPFGMGWSLSTSSIRRKTDKGIPRYFDNDESDVFLISGAEDLVPTSEWDAHSQQFGGRKVGTRCEGGRTFRVFTYQPRIEGSFNKILRLTDIDTGEIHWEVKSPENTTTIFGDSENCRIFNPNKLSEVFEWLPSRTYDQKGNLIIFSYKAEDSAGVNGDVSHEKHRSALSRSAHRYLKSIKYGNTVSRVSPSFSNGTDWLFEVVFDYGEHDEFVPTTFECRPWPCRADPFSSYRSGFEIRQYRLCRRVLMFHHFPDEPAIGKDCVVASLTPSYKTVGRDEKTGLAITTAIKSITHEAWRKTRTGYDCKSLPPVEFTYSEAKTAEISQELDSDYLTNLPIGFNDTTYQLIDLEGQGLTGAVSKVDGGLIYIPNHGDGKFGAAETLLSVPGSTFSSSSTTWMDLTGDGKIELVKFDGPTPGYYKRNWDEISGWDSFRPFELLPNISWSDRNTKFVDVTGDGLADVLMLDDNLMCVYHNWGSKGFGDPEYSHPPLDEDHGPRLLFADGVDTIYTADMTGDGLADLVRIRSGEVAYWPNTGYGRFGSKVVMNNSPSFDYYDQFDQSLLRLSDVDGTGATDLIYLGGDTPTIYLNLSGNGWSKGNPIHGFPTANSATNVQVVDLLGRGTACLVWSSSLPGDAGRQIRYLDLMEQGKPYLLISMENNMGSETFVTYTSSSVFYSRDKKAGRPWTSHLPFPVHCIEKSQTIDRISGNIFTTRYAYHDGYFDGAEREFRGFGMVEAWDTEHYSNFDPSQRLHSNIDPVSHIPPILSKTWFHTGQFQNDRCPTRYYQHEYYCDLHLQPELSEMELSETLFPTALRTPSGSVPHDLNYQEQQEAYRALKGSSLRSEVYLVDGTDLEKIPVSVTQANFVVEQRQPLGENKHAVFLIHPKEEVQMHYDRKLYHVGPKMRLDPRVEHSMTLEVDFHGNPLKTVAINYGRRYDDPNPILEPEDRERQRRTFSMLTETSYTNVIDTEAAYVLPLLARSTAYEIINITSVVGDQNLNCRWVPFETCRRVASILSSGRFDVPFVNFEGPYPSATRPYRRIVKKSRSIYKKDDLSGPLPLGVIEPMMLAWKNHDLVFTDYQVQAFIDAGKLKEDEIEQVFRREGAYTRLPGEDGWWSDSGQAFYSPNRSDPPEAELKQAKEKFYLFHRSRTPWDTDEAPTETVYTYDKYGLFVQSVMDPYGGTVSVGERDKDAKKGITRPGYDYRLLVPFIVMDGNRNRDEIAFDILGQVVATATRGKPEDSDGDDISGIKTDLTEKEIKSYFHSPLIQASDLLGLATMRAVYDFHAFYRSKHLENPQPNWSSSITRETHVSDLEEGTNSRVFVGFSYVDGVGGPIQVKSQSEPGPLEPGDALEKESKRGKEEKTFVHHRWITSAWVINNNKGNPVKNYEPFFSDTHHFQDKAIHGVSPIYVYDSQSRTVAIINPDHTWSKVVFTPWDCQAWDKTDTVLIPNPGHDPDVGPFIKRFQKHEYLPTWYEERKDGNLGAEEQKAARASALSAATPAISFVDAMGRECVKFEILRSPAAENPSQAGNDEILRQASYVDIQGLPYKVLDTLGRTASRVAYTFSKVPIKEEHMDNGEKWTLKAVDGSTLRTWNARGQVFRPVYDRKRRVEALYVKNSGSGCKDYLVEKTEFGDLLPDGEANNSRGRIVKSFDQSGVTEMPTYDFKGSPLKSTRQLVETTHGIIDWGSGEDVELEPTSYDEAMKSNALGHVIWTRLPDGTETTYTYNDRGMQETVTTTLASDKKNNNSSTQEVIKEINYDAKGQRTRIMQGNGIETRLSYDKLSFAVTRIVTSRRVMRSDMSSSGSGSESSSASLSKHRRRRRRLRRSERLQDLQYTYDAAGNIANIKDDAKQTIFFRGQRVEPSQSFIYDSIYRLVEARGREHVGQMAASKNGSYNLGHSSPPGGATGDHVHDGKALARYIERYQYDSQGNIICMHHETPAESQSWTRHYEYDEPSAIVPSEKNNRLSRTRLGRNTEVYKYDGPAGITGCMTSMPGRPTLEYDYGDKMVSSSSHSLQETGSDNIGDKDNPEQTFYQYDSTGKRVRKVTTRQTPNGKTLRIKETIYIGGAYEIFRRFDSNGDVTFESHSLTIAESGRRLLLIDHRTIGSDIRAPDTVYRYQLANHQGSATTEVDQDANILSYEEYTPYGASSLRSTFGQTEVPKRYRFLGKELDESGLYQLGARYYAAWLGRFTSADPKGAADGLNLYQYAQSNPVMLADPGGTQAGPVDSALGWTQKVLADRRNLVRLARENLSSAFSWRSKLGTNNNIFGDRATKDFVRMLQNKAGEAGAKFAQFEETFGTSRMDALFREGGEAGQIAAAWEHKLVSVGYYFKKSGEFRKGKADQFAKGLAGWVAQYENATANLGGVGPNLGVTMKKVAEGGKDVEAFMEKVKAAFPSRAIEFVQETAPDLVHARGEIDAAAKIASPISRQLLLTGTKVAKAVAPVAAGIGKVGLAIAKKVGPAAVAIGILSLASTAYAAETGKEFLGGAPAKPMTGGEKFQYGLDVESMVGSGVVVGAKLGLAKGVIGAGTAAGAAVAATVVGGAAAGAAVGTMVQEALEQPAEKLLGKDAGAVAAAGTGLLAGAATGALVGAAIGTAVPVVGNVAGAVIGGVAGAVGAGAKMLINKYWN
ncbi:hypothetical protein EsH8_X_000163 [Colletotrichum jinshuiense]